MKTKKQNTIIAHINSLGISPWPWRIAQGDDFTKHGYVRDANDKLIANAWPNAKGDFDQVMANARLIAAAPSLYEEARVAAKILDALHIDCQMLKIVLNNASGIIY